MKTILPTVLLALALMGTVIIHLSDAQLSDAQRAAAFSCGYLYGQNAVGKYINGLTLTKAEEFPTECADARRQAVAHGFDTAAKDLP